jgi:8-oxo-dGTP pyrophosphatase MutT (NUDIX family)
MEATWDGIPVAREPPYASCVVVWREGAAGREFLVLHRAHFGPDFAGDWAWTPPSGARRTGESPDAAAARELREETGLDLPLARIESRDPDLALYVAEAPHGSAVVVDADHDAHRWLPLEAAAELCLPAMVAEGLRTAATASA